VVSSSAQEVNLDSGGVRAGTSANRRSDSFRQVEAVVDFRLPWQGTFRTNWWYQTRLELTSGWLSGEGENGVVLSAGPNVKLGHNGFPLALIFGTSPTFLTRQKFGSRDLGYPLEFTSHLGVNWNVNSLIALSYRYQHMSNCGLGTSNPGLNLHMFAVSYRF